MTFSIVSLGSIDFLTTILNSVAMVCGTGDFNRLVAVGFLMGLLFIGFQCILEGGQRINLHQTFLCFIVYLCMFGPSCTVVVEDAYTGRARTVDNVPLGVGVAGTAISNIGLGLTRMIEQGYGTTDRMTEHEFAEPLRILSSLRSSDEMNKVLQAIDQELGPKDDGRPSDSKQALVNYLSECTMTKIQLGGITTQTLGSAQWSDFQLPSEAHAVYLPIPGTGMTGTVSCAKGFGMLDKIWQKLSTSTVKTAFNLMASIKDEHGNISSSGDGLDNALQAMNASFDSVQDLERMMVIEAVYDRAAKKFYDTTMDVANAIAINQAIEQRNTQWSAEATMFMNSARALMAFFEGFIYAITPIVAFLMVIGSFGLKLTGKYFLVIAWIQLWLPILSILNLYVLSGASEAIARSTLGMTPSIYVVTTLYREAQTWVSTGGMLMASTPLLSLFLVSGSMYAFTTLTGRLGGQDHVNERISSPDSVQPSAYLARDAFASSNRVAGVRMGGADRIAPSLDMSSALSSAVSSKESTSASLGQQALVNFSRSSEAVRSSASGSQLTHTLMNNLSTQFQNLNSSERTFLEQYAQSMGMNNQQMLQSIYQTGLSGSVGANVAFGKGSFAPDEDPNSAQATNASSVATPTSQLASDTQGANAKQGDKGWKDKVLGAHATAKGSYQWGATDSNSISQSGSLTTQTASNLSASQQKRFAAISQSMFNRALGQVDSKTFSDVASEHRGTQMGDSFSKAAEARKSYEEAQNAQKSFGFKQPFDLFSMANQFAQTSHARELFEYKNSLSGQALEEHTRRASQFERLNGGHSGNAQIAASVEMLSKNDPMKLIGMMQDSGLVTTGLQPEMVKTQSEVMGNQQVPDEASFNQASSLGRSKLDDNHRYINAHAIPEMDKTKTLNEVTSANQRFNNRVDQQGQQYLGEVKGKQLDAYTENTSRSADIDYGVVGNAKDNPSSLLFTPAIPAKTATYLSKGDKKWGDFYRMEKHALISNDDAPRIKKAITEEMLLEAGGNMKLVAAKQKAIENLVDNNSREGLGKPIGELNRQAGIPTLSEEEARRDPNTKEWFGNNLNLKQDF